MLSKKLIPIRGSRCFDATGYFNQRAAFRYHNGRVIYRDIPVTLWQRFMEAESKGKFFREHIKKFVRQAGSVMVPFPCGVTPGPFSRGSAPPVQSEVSESYFSASQASKPEKSNARFNLK